MPKPADLSIKVKETRDVARTSWTGPTVDGKQMRWLMQNDWMHLRGG